MKRITVVGAGSWGTALAKVLGDKGYPVVLWDRDPQSLQAIARERVNGKYLPKVSLPESLTVEPDLARAVAGAPVVVSVVPSHAVREVFGRAGKAMEKETLVISASKGIENETLQTMDEVLKEALPASLGAHLAFLSGPSFAKEVGAGLPTAVVMASREREVAERAATLFRAERFRVYTSDDVPGVELGGALKNVMAIAAGVADGMGLGHNSRAALITRGLAEISRLAVRRSANPLTLAGLAGLGDLVLTCTGDLSRNRSVGVGLGQGKHLDEVLAGMSQVAEGVKTTKSAYDLAARLGVEMPITNAIYRILYEEVPAGEAIVELMTRAPKHELA